MVTFVAQQAVNNSKLSELGLFSNFKQLRTPSVTDLDHFVASKGSISMMVTGKNMTCVLKVPQLGTLKGIAVTVDNVAKYQLTNIDVPFKDIQSLFSGNFASDLFRFSDTITGSNKADKLNGYNGGDHMEGNSGNDIMLGGQGNDDLEGQAGNDTMNGNAGNDILDGGPGKNTLTGGGGKDGFLFDSELDKGNVSTITDYTQGQDYFQLDNVAFPGIGGRGPLKSVKFVEYSDYAGQNNVVIYNQVTGAVYYQTTGTQLNNAIQFAKVGAGIALDNGDFFVV